jgi:HEAT repeat protein
VIPRATSTDVLVRESAAQALGRFARQGHPEEQQSVEALSHLLNDTSFKVRRNSIESLVMLQAVSELSAIEAVADRKPDDSWMEAIEEWARTELSGIAQM